MKKVIQKEKIKYFCDFCNKELENIPIDLNFGYPTPLDGSSKEFCSIKCLKDFIKKELQGTNCNNCKFFNKSNYVTGRKGNHVVDKTCDFNLKSSFNCKKFKKRSWLKKILGGK